MLNSKKERKMKKVIFLVLLSTVGLFVSAQTVRYVTLTGNGNGTSWQNSSGDLQAMIDTVFKRGGGEVHVAAGKYLPIYHANGSSQNSRDRAFVLKSNVSIYGGYSSTDTTIGRNGKAYPTILSGNIGDTGSVTDNCYHVVVSAGEAGTVCLDGLIIQDALSIYSDTGSINIKGYTIRRDCGGGMAVYASNVKF